MLKRTLHSLFYVLTGIAVAVLIACALAAWRLSQGPASLAWAVPSVEYLINRTSQVFSYDIDDIIVSWEGWSEGLDVRFVGVSVSDRDRQPVARLPELSVGLSADALRSLRLAPTEIHLSAPRLRLVRRTNGTLEFGFAESEGGTTPVLDFLSAALAEPRDPSNPFSYLESVTISNGRFVYHDRKLNASWRGRLSNAQLVRHDRRMSFQGTFEFSAGQEVAGLELHGSLDSSTKTLAARATFQGFRPSDFAPVGAAFAPLAAVDVPLDGIVSLVTDDTGTLKQADVDVRGGNGRLALTTELAGQLGVAHAAQELGVRAVDLAGRYDAGAGDVEVRSFAVTFDEGTTLRVPEPLDQEFPLAAIKGRGGYRIADDRISVDALNLDLAGPTVSVEGHVDQLSAATIGEAVLKIGRVNGDSLATYWPKIVAPGARKWCLAHLSGGALVQGEVRLAFAPAAGSLDVTELNGTMKAAGVTVDYLPPAPPVRNAAATASFNLRRFDLAITRAEAGGLTLSDGSAVIPDLDVPVSHLNLDLGLKGRVPDVLTFLAGEPFGFTKDIGFDPRETRGNATARLRLGLPLVEDPEIKDMTLAATADVSDLYITGALLGGDVTSGNLHISLDDKAMDIVGQAAFENVPGRVAWHENFAGKPRFVRQIDVAFPALRAATLRKIKPEVIAIVEQWVKGPVGAKARVTFRSERDIVFDADVDGTNTAMVFPSLGWTKARGQRAFAHVRGRLAGDHLVEIAPASLSAAGLEAAGSAKFGRDGGLERAIVDHLKSGKTDSSAILTLMPDTGWDLTIGGAGLDLGPAIREVTGEGDGGGKTGADTHFDTFTFSADLDRLWLGSKTPIQAVTGTVVRDKKTFALVQLAGVVGQGDPVTVDIGPGSPGPRTLRIRAEDAGSGLRALNIFSDMVGGKLRVDGTFDDTRPDEPLEGTLKTKNFRMIRQPILARILNVMALTGILDLLRGEGIAFSTLDVPFTFRDGILDLTEAKMHGNSMGITASGTYNVNKDLIDIRGTLVPFYFINSLFGRLPIIGRLFSGGERGGGLFAARYSVTGNADDPDISVNPISALAPGVLRNLFGLFDGSPNSTSGTPRIAPEPQPRHSP